MLSSMSELTNAVCFTCGLTIELPPRLSRLTNGQVCPTCRDRVLHWLPPALPSAPQAREPELEVEERVQAREAEWHGPDDGRSGFAS